MAEVIDLIGDDDDVPTFPKVATAKRNTGGYPSTKGQLDNPKDEVVSVTGETPVKMRNVHEEENLGAGSDFDEDGAPLFRTVSAQKRDLLPRHQRKAVNQILDHHRRLDRDRVQAAVRTYCELNPDLTDINEIAEAVWGQLQLAHNPDEFVFEDGTHVPYEDYVESQMSDDVQFISTTKQEKTADYVEDDDAYLNDIEVIAKLSPVGEVLRIFPNAKVPFVEDLLRKYDFKVEAVVQLMIEKGYDKEQKVTAEKRKEYDFNSTSWTTTEEYQHHAVVELINNFPFIRHDCVSKFFRVVGKHHYYPSLKKLEEVTGERSKLNFRDSFKGSVSFSKAMINGITKHIEDFDKKETKKPEGVTSYASLLNLRMSTKHLPPPPNNTNDVLEQEILWVRSKRREEMEKDDAKMAEELNNQIAEAEGALIECQCCFSEYPFENLVQCTEGHLFCKNCLLHYVEETVFGGGRSTIKCMSSDNCTGFFSESMIQAAVSEKVFSKYSEALTRDALKAAHIDDLVTCYNCELQVSLPADSGIVLTCPSCRHETCRYCKDEAHIPLKCSEVEKKSDTKARLSVEEAMTTARVRECPKCSTKFYKTEGCNKMTCSCGALLCYICRKDITKEGYRHFCQTPHCDHKTCNHCKLHTNTIEDDRRAMLDAGLKTLKEYEADEAADNGEPDNNKPKIEIDKLLEGGAIKPTLPGAPQLPGGLPMVNPLNARFQLPAVPYPGVLFPGMAPPPYQYLPPAHILQAARQMVAPPVPPQPPRDIRAGRKRQRNQN